LIKISKQSTKILEFHSNSKLSHIILVSNNISNRYALSDYTETHSNTTKNDLLGFLEILK